MIPTNEMVQIFLQMQLRPNKVVQSQYTTNFMQCSYSHQKLMHIPALNSIYKKKKKRIKLIIW